MVQSTPIWAGGMKIAHPLAYREILAGMNAGMGLSPLLEAHQLKLTESKDSALDISPRNIPVKSSWESQSSPFLLSVENY